jgi:hypothetical protein
MSRPLRAADLVPGRVYLSPSGRLCRLLPADQFGIGSTAYTFGYLSRSDDTFAISADNVRALAAMREAPTPQAEFAARFGAVA